MAVKEEEEFSSASSGPKVTGSRRRAVIDVGTNSVKLLIADVGANGIKPVVEKSEQTRLGKGFYETHLLQRDAIAATAEAVGAFAREARGVGAESIRIIATSAARDAKNSRDLIESIEGAAHLPLEVISGEMEAELAFRGVCTNATLAATPLLILDVGGGSTEFIVGDKGHQHFRESFQLGTVRLLERLPHSDPPTVAQLEGCLSWIRQFLRDNVAPKLKPALAGKGGIRLVGTGGTTTILARMEKHLETFDRDTIESTVLTRGQIRSEMQRLWRMPLNERQHIVGLPPKRADVILFGVAIYDSIMHEFDFATLNISTRGLRYAALLPT